MSRINNIVQNAALADNQFLSMVNNPDSKFGLSAFVKSDYQGFIDKIKSYEVGSEVYASVRDGNFNCLENVPQFMLDALSARSLFEYMLEYGFKSSSFEVDLFRGSVEFMNFVSTSIDFLDESNVNSFLQAVDGKTMSLFLSRDDFKGRLDEIFHDLDDSILEEVLVGGGLEAGAVDQLMSLSENSREKITGAISDLNVARVRKLLNNFDTEVAIYFSNEHNVKAKLLTLFSSTEDILSILADISRDSLDNLLTLSDVRSKIGSVVSQMNSSKENDTFFKLVIKSGSVSLAKCVFGEGEMISKLTPTQQTSIVKWFVWDKVNSPELLKYLLSVKELVGVGAEENLQLDYANRLNMAVRGSCTEKQYEDCITIFKAIPKVYVESKKESYSELFASSGPLPECLMTEKLSGVNTEDCQSLVNNITNRQFDELLNECVAPEIAPPPAPAPSQVPAALQASAQSSFSWWDASIVGSSAVSVFIGALAVARECSRSHHSLESLLDNGVASHYNNYKGAWLSVMGATAAYAVYGVFFGGDEYYSS